MRDRVDAGEWMESMVSFLWGVVGVGRRGGIVM